MCTHKTIQWCLDHSLGEKSEPSETRHLTNENEQILTAKVTQLRGSHLSKPHRMSSLSSLQVSEHKLRFTHFYQG